MAKIGRPLKEIEKKTFEKLCSMMCTEDEIASFFGCSVDTINRYCKREYKQTFAEVYITYQNQGKIALRRYQFQHAEKNPGMAQYLGKVILKQRVNDSVGSEEVLSKTFDMMESAFKEE